MKNPRAVFGYGSLLIGAGLILALAVTWQSYIPHVVTVEASQRFYPPAMTVSASLMIAVSVAGAAVLTRREPKPGLADLALFSLAVILLMAALLMSAWGLISGGTDVVLDTTLIGLVPTVWLVGSLLLLEAMVFPYIGRTD